MLATVWFAIWGLLWAVYFVLDGYDLGLGMLIPVLGRSERDRQLIHRAISPFWDGNEVWLITAGAMTFAAFPAVYATLFSALYVPLMLILVALILRGVTFAFRGKIKHEAWRRLWDSLLALGSFMAALLFGVAFANLFRGLPIDAAGTFQGNLLTLLNPYGLAGGLLFVVLLAFHGALWLTTRSTDELNRRADQIARQLWLVLLVVAAGFLMASWWATRLCDNYRAQPLLFAVPALAVAGLLAARWFLAQARWHAAWLASAVAVLCTAAFGVVGLYPNLILSSLDPAHSLTIANSASSPLTLRLMLLVVVIFLPLVVVYQVWVHRLFARPLADDEAAYEEGY